jgi:hypothetical protein
MIVSHEHRLIFVKTRKTAGSSVEAALWPHLGPRDIATPLQHDRDEARNIGIPVRRWRAYDSYLKVRTGKVVFYNHMPATRIRRLLPREWRDYFTFTIVRNPYDVAVSAYHWARQYHAFADASVSDFLASSHAAHYSNWEVYGARGRVIVDHVVRYETLARDFAAVTARLGLPSLDLPMINAAMRTDRRHYRNVLSTNDRRRVESLYGREITHFGYVF